MDKGKLSGQMASSDQPSPSLFIEEELDDVNLTQEDYYNAKFPSISTTDSVKFLEKFHSHSAAESPGSCGSDISPSSSDCNEHSSDGNDRKAGDIELRTLAGTSSISGLSQIKVRSWNDFPHCVFRNFKVKSYIVRPNYFLSVSRTKSEQSSAFDDFLTIDNILQEISETTKFPKWTEIQGDIDTLLLLYDGMNEITDPLLSPDDAKQKAQEFSKKLARLERSPDLEPDSYLLQAASCLRLFTVDLIESLKNQHFSEDLSQTYITILIVFFTNLMPRPFSYHHRKRLRLDLRDNRLNQGRCMNVEPDLSVYYHCFCFLVGEVEKHRVSWKKREENKSDGNELQSGKSNDSGEPLTKRCKSNLEGNDDCQDGNSIMQKLNVDNEGVRTEKDNTCGDVAFNAEELNSKYYRHLKQEEEIQVCRYLPRLFAEMLAATAVNNPNVRIGRPNETVQLGFGLDGFKLRFVRLVLRHCDEDERRPTIADIRNPKVRCDIFLTKEFDLFNQSHLKMFFQMLFAFTYVNDVRPHPR